MEINPYKPEWIGLDGSDENFIQVGMQVIFPGEDDATRQVYRVQDISHADGETDGETTRYWPTKVTVDGESWYLDDLAFLCHEVEYNKNLYIAKNLLRSVTTHMRWYDGRYFKRGGMVRRKDQGKLLLSA